MELAFVEKALRDLCASRIKLDRRLGTEVAAALRHRLADLRAAATIHELILNRPCPLNESGQLAMDVAGGIRLVFCPNHNTMPTDRSGKIDWTRVTRIKIVAIEGVQ